MIYRFTIEGRLPGLNDFKSSARGRPWWACQKAKQEAMNRVMWDLRRFQVPHFVVPVTIRIREVEPNARRDRDNVSGGASKVILDAMKHLGIIKNDSRKWVLDCRHDTTQIDKKNPRIEVEIEEVAA